LLNNVPTATSEENFVILQGVKNDQKLVGFQVNGLEMEPRRVRNIWRGVMSGLERQVAFNAYAALPLHHCI
jgi:hypothetical protein